MSVKEILFVTSILLMTTSMAEFHGRHVCKHQQIIAEPLPVQQSYIRAVHRKDLQRTVYQTAYKTVFKMQIRYTNVSGCCPGWEKKTAREGSCMQPVCEEGCENEGQCIGPGICLCNEGYTGYRCQIDIDECSGRNNCQQKCKNLPGSYECSCQDGFQLANDEYTCNLCISCTDEFKNLSAQVEKLQNGNHQEFVVGEIWDRIDNLTIEIAQTSAVHNIQSELDKLNNMAVHKDVFVDLEKKVDSLKVLIADVDFQDLSTRIDDLKQSSLQTERLIEIQNEIDGKASVKEVEEIAQTLNDTITRLLFSDAQTKQLDEVQKQLDELTIVKAQQDEAHAGKLQEVNKELEVLREGNNLADTLEEVRKQVEKVSEQVQILEFGQLDQRNESTLQNERYLGLQREVGTLKEAIKNEEVIKAINNRIDNLAESSLHTREFQDINKKMESLASLEVLTETADNLNATIEALRPDDSQAQLIQDMRKQIEELEAAKAQHEDIQADMVEEMHKQLEELKEIKTLTRSVQEMKEHMADMANRIRELESEKAILKTNLTEVKNQCQTAMNAFHAKEVHYELTTTDPEEMDQKVPLDRLVSLSEQISILEERMADCQCGQDYSRG